MIHEIRADGLWLLKAWSILEQPRQELANDMDGSTRLPSRQAHCRSHPCRPYHLLSLGLTQISSFQPESSKRELSVSAWGLLELLVSLPCSCSIILTITTTTTTAAATTKQNNNSCCWYFPYSTLPSSRSLPLWSKNVHAVKTSRQSCRAAFRG